MKLLWIALAVVTGTVLHADEPGFLRTVRPEDYAAAGLQKLSPQELARLEALVRDYKRGGGDSSTAQMEERLAAAQRDVTAAAQARAEAEIRAAQAEAAAKTAAAETAAARKAEKTSLLAKAKVMLTPGTEIEYATVESRIAGDFRGWHARSTFTLENGQRWQVTGTDTYASPPIPHPAVKIVPGMLGAFWMTVEGVNPRAKVTPIGGAK